MDDIAQRDSVEVSITPDGAELCDGLCHLTAGIKVTDPRAVDPRDGKRLSCLYSKRLGRFLHAIDNGTKSFLNKTNN